MIADGCSFNGGLNFTVALKDNGATIEQRIINSGSCVNGLCQTSFVFTSSRNYTVSVTATNGIGISSGTIESSTIGELFGKHELVLGSQNIWYNNYYYYEKLHRWLCSIVYLHFDSD